MTIKNKRELGVACLGAGYFSQFHIDAWNRLPEVQLRAIADLSTDNARQMLLDHAPDSAAADTYNSLDSMLQAVTPDVLDIITPPPTHLAAIRLAAQHSIKTVICQKPFCLSLDEATQAVSIAKSAGMTLVVHENFRFMPWFRCIKQNLDLGEIGTPLQTTFRLRTGDGQGPDAYLERQPYFQTMPRLLVHETGVHYVDTFRYLLGQPSAVYADTRRCNPVIKGEDAAYIIFDYFDGSRALFDGNRLLDNGAENARLTLGVAELEGTEGTMSLFADGAVTLRRHGETASRTLLKPQQWHGFGGDCVYALQAHVVSALLDGNAFENTADEYLSVVSLVEQIYKSAKDGVKLPVPG